MNNVRTHNNWWWVLALALYVCLSLAATLYATACFTGSGCGYAALAILPVGFVLTIATIIYAIVLLRAAVTRYATGSRRLGGSAIAIVVMLPVAALAWIFL